MKEHVILPETADLAREKNFQWSCKNYYLKGKFFGSAYKVCNKRNAISAPTQSLLQKWLRDEKQIQVLVYRSVVPDGTLRYGFELYTGNALQNLAYGHLFATYEDALEAGLVEGLKLIK